MARFETLARASCTLVPLPASRLGLLASQHVTHPHAFRHYYPTQEYLEAVTDADLRYSIEVCEEGTGGILARYRLPASVPVLKHDSRDVSIVPLRASEEGAALMDAMRGVGHAVSPLPLLAEDAELAGPLTIAGHFLLGSGADGVMLPRRLSGALAQRSAQQVFLKTPEVLEMGMCGGPVAVEGGSLAGIVEGIVPLLKPGEEDGALTPLQRKARELLGGCAVIVEARDLKRIISQV